MPFDAGDRAPLASTDRLLATLQQLLPTRLLSRAMHGLAASRRIWLKGFLIALFRRLYRVDLADAAIHAPADYSSFNAFFTRALRNDARPLPEQTNALVCPVDGRLGTAGDITRGTLLQAKGATYEVAELLQDESLAAPFLGGSYATLYLAPADYHRVHMPLAGTLSETRYLPGRLFGVNPASVRAIPRLFTRNERLACLFETAVGPMGVVLVGAFCVGGIETVWQGPVTRAGGGRRTAETFPAGGDDTIRLQRGDELGRFNLGSTVILLFGGGAVTWRSGMLPGNAVRMGQPLARMAFGA